jgi:putative ABC transport system permease protein
VAQRRQEMGIRLALGAAKADIVRLIVQYGLTLAAVGIGVGWAAAAMLLSLVLKSTLSNILYKVSVHDYATFVGAPILFLLIAVLASYLPARRATLVDPNEALRG